MTSHIKESKIQYKIKQHYDNGGNVFELDGDIFLTQCEVKVGGNNRVDIAITHGRKEKPQVTIIEVKSENIRSCHIAQVCRYKKSIENSGLFNSISKFNYIIIGKRPKSINGTCLDPYYISSCIDDLSIFHYSPFESSGDIFISGFMGVESDPFKVISMSGGRNEKINCDEMIATFKNQIKI